MKLGNLFQLHISTNDAGSSISFYKLMGFTQLASIKKPFKQVVMSDGRLNILLAEDDFYGLEYYAEDMQEKAAEIEGKGIDYVNVDLQLGDTWYKVVKDPNDFLIGLVAEAPEYFNEIKNNDFEPRGSFREISILSEKKKESVEFWEKFGFEKKNDNGAEGKGISLSDGKMGIGFYTRGSCSHYFEGPAIKLVDKNMQKIINDLKEAGLKFQEELKDNNGKLSGAIALSPEGQAFFLFSE
jgi:hypothetical protein